MSPAPSTATAKKSRAASPAPRKDAAEGKENAPARSIEKPSVDVAAKSPELAKKTVPVAAQGEVSAVPEDAAAAAAAKSRKRNLLVQLALIAILLTAVGGTFLSSEWGSKVPVRAWMGAAAAAVGVGAMAGGLLIRRRVARTSREQEAKTKAA